MSEDSDSSICNSNPPPPTHTHTLTRTPIYFYQVRNLKSMNTEQTYRNMGNFQNLNFDFTVLLSFRSVANLFQRPITLIEKKLHLISVLACLLDF